MNFPNSIFCEETKLFNCDLQQWHSANCLLHFSCFISVCPFVALLKFCNVCRKFATLILVMLTLKQRSFLTSCVFGLVFAVQIKTHKRLKMNAFEYRLDETMATYAENSHVVFCLVVIKKRSLLTSCAFWSWTLAVVSCFLLLFKLKWELIIIADTARPDLWACNWLFWSVKISIIICKKINIYIYI